MSVANPVVDFLASHCFSDPVAALSAGAEDHCPPTPNPGVLHFPLIELHAHLNGSIPLALLRTFAAEDNASDVLEKLLRCSRPLDPAASTPPQRMAHCMTVFDCVFKLMTRRERLFAATLACCNAFFDGGCVYVEIRTTPKPLADGTSSDQYVATVLSAMQKAVDVRNSSSNNRSDAATAVTVRANLLLSLNRKTSASDATHAPEVLALASKYRSGVADQQQQQQSQAPPQAHRVAVTGIDLCGDTYFGDFRKDLEPWLRRAQQDGWPLTVHCGERDDDDEVQAMLLLAPRRLGHCVFVNDAAKELIATAQVPLELCLSSNMTTGGLASVHDHHIRDWIVGAGGALHSHPIAICTDDFSVFHTDLRREVLLFAEVVDGLHAASAPQQRRPKHDPSAHADAISKCSGGNGSNSNNRDADDGGGAEREQEEVRRRIEVAAREIFRAQLTAARSAFVGEADRALLLQHITARCVQWFAAFRATKLP